MSNRTSLIFKGLEIVAWLILIGLFIELCALIIHFAFNFIDMEMVKDMYGDFDLGPIYESNPFGFFSLYAFILALTFFKVGLFWIVVRLVMTIDLTKPFNSDVARYISRISLFTFTIGILSLIGSRIANFFLHRGYETDGLDQFWSDSQAFIIMAAVIYIIAMIFKRGIEMQSENELTV